MTRALGFDTLQLHAGQVPDPATGARAVPIYQTTSFVFRDFEAARGISSAEEDGYDYSRIVNPTNDVLEKRVAALEGGSAALALASGSAATAVAILNLAGVGDDIVAAKTLYGGTFNLLSNTLPRHGISSRLVDPSDPDNFRRAIGPRTRAVLVETIGNPDINLVDYEAVARVAHEAGLPLLVDNTFASPFLFRPFDHGANVVIHSATKYLGGHGTSLGGLVVDGGNFDWGSGRFPGFTEPDPSYGGFVHWEKWRETAFVAKARLQYLRDFGACLSPFNAFLLLQGIETLSLRLARQTESALRIAEFLEARPDVEWVSYPGLASSPYRALADRYLPRGTGGILAFGVKGGRERAIRLIEALKVFSFLANVGDSKSLVVHPATVTHGQLSEEEQRLAGVKPEQIRLSIGTEDLRDLLWDLEQALEAA